MRVDPAVTTFTDGALSHDNPLIMLVAVAILAPVCLWVYRDAARRYQSLTMPLLWAIAVFLALIVFLPLYLMFRPPKKP